MRFCCVVLMCVLSVSFTVTAKATDPIQARMELIDRFVYDGPLFLQGKSLSDLRRLGRLQNEKVEKQPHRFIPGQTIEYRTLTYDGLVVYGDIVGPNRLAPILIIVTSPSWKIKHGLSVGAPIARVTKALGEPTKTENQTLQYCGETECASFTVTDGKIAKIRFDYYAD